MRRERIDIAQIPKDKDNCGGLAEVVEVSPCMCKHHVVNHATNMSLDGFMNIVTDRHQF